VINSTAQPLLSAGTLYYLYSKEPGNEYDGWYWNSVSAQGSYINSRNGGPYFTGTDVQAAFRVEVTPEPAGVAGAAPGYLALGLPTKRRQVTESWQDRIMNLSWRESEGPNVEP